MHQGPSTDPFDPATTTRPIPKLLMYYVIVSALTTVAFPFVFLPLFCKYRSLKYKFDAEGISMSWGILFKREVYLTFRRIQDIHVSRGIIQRQLGLATVAVQTASGSSGAEMSIEGIGDPEGLRDYLYSRMRGSISEAQEQAEDVGAASPHANTDEALDLLHQILQQVKRLNQDRSAGEVNDDWA